MPVKIISEARTFGGSIATCAHESESNKCTMRFTVFTPPQASDGKVPVCWWLSGLTCTEENFTVKAGAYRAASALGMMIIAPDTSPRGDDVADDEAYDLGQGAGFYLNATKSPWAEHFQMYDYITRDLPEAVFNHFPGDSEKQSISGHSMGGHGALTIGIRNAQTFKSISAFAPIVSPMNCPWGHKAFNAYLGSDGHAWADYDACALLRAAGDRSACAEILIDQGTDDEFLEQQLKPQLFETACEETGQALRLRLQDGYDHSYFFIATFIEDHLRHHMAVLANGD